MCGPSGFDPAVPSVVYLLLLPDPPILKVGVTGVGRTRLDAHRCRGWEVLRTWSAATGADALEIEAAVIARWRERDAVPPDRREVPAGQGWTGSVHVGRGDVPQTVADIEGLRAGRSRR